MSLIDELREALRSQGAAQATITTDEEADEWRRAARSAARGLSRPVETTRVGHVAIAALRDWPANELERQVTDARVREVMARLDAGSRE